MKSLKDKSLASLIKEADEVFSDYVRLSRANGNGYLSCFITGERIHWTKADAAHYIDRRHMAVRFDAMNVHPTTIETNRFDDLHKAKYRNEMISVYGVHEVSKLEAKGRQLTKFTRFELREIIDSYKQKIKEL